MRNKNRNQTIILVIAAIVILTGFSFYKMLAENQKLRQSIPYLLKGEKINYFNLLDGDAKMVDESVLQDNRVSLIFIFSRPCSPCDRNLTYWRKMVQVLKKQEGAAVYGIILDNETNAFNFSREARLNFNAYVPHDLDRTIKHMRINLNFSQTIVYKKGVQYIKLGELSGKETVKIIKLVRDLS